MVFGEGSHGQEVYEIASSLHVFDRVEFLDDNENKINNLGPWEDIYELRNDFSAAIVAVVNEDTRKLWFSKLTEADYVIPSLVHPSAIISSTATLGVGSVICARAAVSPGVKIGTGCIISAGVAVARDTAVEDWTHIDVGGVVNWHQELPSVINDK